MAKIEKIVENLQAFIKETSTVEKYRVSEQDFIRDSKLGFETTVYLQLQRMKGSLSSDLYNYLTMNNLSNVTSSAFSQSRYKIDSDLFLGMNKLLLANVYSDCFMDSPKLFAGYKVHAVDGTKLVLPNTKILQSHFGTQIGGNKETPTETAMCLLMCCYDVLNHYLVQAELQGLKTGEQSVAKTWVEQFDSQAITIFDRAYASMFFCYQMLLHEKPFIMRVKLGFNKVVKAFVASDGVDSIVTFEAKAEEIYDNKKMPKGTKIQVRLVKITLPNGETEVLLTSLFDRNVFNIAAMNKLYQMRWGIETAYNRLKNQLLIMCFSGIKIEAIYQDVYATIFMHNFQQMFINEAQVIVNEEVVNCEHLYKVNHNVATSIFKFKIIPLFLTKNPQEIVEELVNIFSKNRVAVRNDKKANPRKKSIAKRRNLMTQTNFKRA